MRNILILVILVLHVTACLAHPWKPANYVIIDTDGGFDDMRTICMLLASPDVRVLAITSSNWVVDAKQGYIKVRSLLKDLHHDGILTGMNNSDKSTTKNCQPAMNFEWGDDDTLTDTIPLAENIVNYALANTQEPISFLCLGSLSTPAVCLQQSKQFNKRVKEIIWTTESQMNEENFNYAISPVSYDYIVKESGMPLHAVYGTLDAVFYDEYMQLQIKQIENPFSEKMSESLHEELSPFALKWFDEMAVVYLHYPFLYGSDSSGLFIGHKLRPAIILDSLRYYAYRIVQGNTVNRNQVLVEFPYDTAAYFTDVQKNMMASIKKYGKEEWEACVLGNELHRHLGSYAVIGVKMGIRAREYFGAGIDEIRVYSYAGLTPPFSCLNDGLQVSTGATLGHGLIEVDSQGEKIPGALFTYLGQTIEIVLKDEYRKRIEREIHELSMIYGINSNIYWEMVRIAALNYWANWDRHEIFEIHVVK